MKAVLASLKPYWYYLVGEGIKTIEVRKTFPKAEDWSKDTFFYMSRDEKSFAEIPKEFQEKYRKHFGKVGLRFVCDNIEEIEYHPNYYVCRLGTQLSNSEMWEYGRGKPLYAWHISNLIIYDKPMELGEFVHECNGICIDTKTKTKCPRISVDGFSCNGLNPITRPPQSWCYVERSESYG